MPPEVLSTVRPTPLRLAGFLFVAVGGLLTALGALQDWAVVGFPGDTAGKVDVAVKGIDAWEGVAVLAAATAALIVLLAIRLVSARSTRRALAVTIVVLGLLACGLALSVAVRLESRFGGGQGLEDIARSVSKQLDLPQDTVHAQLEQQFGRQLRVDPGIGIWLSVTGGALVAVGGALSLAWAARTAKDPESSPVSEDGDAPADETGRAKGPV